MLFLLCIDERMDSSAFYVLCLCRQEKLCKFFRNIDKNISAYFKQRIFFRIPMWDILYSTTKKFVMLSTALVPCLLNKKLLLSENAFFFVQS